MRRMWVLYLTLGLVASQGCHKTLQHTAGVCDCYPPPVESLLVAPCPSGGHGHHGPYAAAPHVDLQRGHAPMLGNNSTILHGSAPLPNAPARSNTPIVTPSTEPIRSLPSILEKK